jgi:nicotinamidase-related amidase
MRVKCFSLSGGQFIHNTGLTELLRDKGVTDVYICAVATDLAGEAAARSAHDNDFSVTVIGDACAAATVDDHRKSLAFLPKIATVVNVEDLKL